MSWVNELVDLYEKNDDKIGVIEYRRDMPYVLLPPFHTGYYLLRQLLQSQESPLRSVYG